jgi:hypothetical protein
VDLAKRSGIPSLESLPLYDLKVSVDPTAGTLDIQQETYVTNHESAALDSLLFRIHGNPNTAGGPSRSRISLIQGACVNRSCEVRQGPPSVVTVTFEKPLPAGESVRVKFELRGILQRVNPADTGLFAQSLAGILGMGEAPSDGTYGTMSVCDGFLSMANFFPVIGRRKGDAWEPVETTAIGDFGSDELANVRAQIETPALVKVMTPGTVVRSVLVPGAEGQGTRMRHEVAAAMVRGFAVFAGEAVDTLERRVGDVVVRSTHLEGNGDAGARVLDVASHALSVFERRFGPYPYGELDVVEAPLTGGAGGIEFSGLIGVASMLYRPLGKDDPLGALLGAMGAEASGNPAAGMLDETLEFTTAHEVAHQWWYSLVGSDSRSHPFVDESLAQYSTLLYLEDRYGKQRAKQAAEAQVRLNYVGMRLMGRPDGAVDRPASSFDPLSYAGLVYGKGPFFFREARKTMGDAAFFAALRSYADAHRFRTASPEGPLPFLAAGKHEHSVRRLAQRWLRDTHGDADLGPIDLQSLLAVVLGPDAAKMAPQAEELLKLFGPPSPGKPSGTPSSKDPTQVLKQLERMLDSF